jgi:hypothetical protein
MRKLSSTLARFRKRDLAHKADEPPPTSPEFRGGFSPLLVERVR